MNLKIVLTICVPDLHKKHNSITLIKDIHKNLKMKRYTMFTNCNIKYHKCQLKNNFKRNLWTYNTDKLNRQNDIGTNLIYAENC